MKFFLLLCVFCVFVCSVYGAQSIYPANPKYPDGCFSDVTGFMKYDEQKNLEKCLRAYCNEDGSILLVSCGVVDSKCGVTEDPSKPYPDCCPEPLPC